MYFHYELGDFCICVRVILYTFLQLKTIITSLIYVKFEKINFK